MFCSLKPFRVSDEISSQCTKSPSLLLSTALDKESRDISLKADGENLPSTIVPSHCCSSGRPEKATATKITLLDTKVVAISPCLTDTSLTEVTGKRAKIPG